MLFSIKELELRKIRFDETFQAGEIDFPGTELKQSGPLRAEGEVELLPHTDGEVRIKGSLQGAMAAECDRCLSEVLFAIDTSIDLFYRPASDIEADENEEIEIDDGEAEIAFYEGKGIELEQLVAEQVLLLLPMQVVCNEACKGICPVCGGNRNQTGCTCQTVPADDRWSALKDLVS
jgi:uncharacterized protein